MAEEGAKRERTELQGLPPRKRFKVMEQQRRREIQEEEIFGAVADTHCSDITNMVPQHRVSPRKLASQGFLVLEKQKYKLQQQRLQENLVPPLPPRPVAVKRKEAPTLPLPKPPPTRLKLQGEKDHSLASSAFKSWGKPESRRDQALSGLATTWTMAKGTTCSTNKAQEDVEMLVSDVPGLSSDVCSSDEDVVVSTSTTTSPPTETLDLNVVAESDHENTVEASQVAETASATSAVLEDVIHEGQGVVDLAADTVHLEDTHVTEVAHVQLENTSKMVAAVLADVPKVNDEKIVENAQLLDTYVEHSDISRVEELILDVSETPVKIRKVEEEPEADTQNATLDAPEILLERPLAIDDETCSEEEAAQAVIDEVKVDERDALEITEVPDEHEADAEQDGSLAAIDEQAEKLFKRMFEREGCTGHEDEEDGQFFFAWNGVNNFNSLVMDMEVDGRSKSNAQASNEASTPALNIGIGGGLDVSSLEDHMKPPTVVKPDETPERSESSSRDEDCEDLEAESPILVKSQVTVCKSSKADSDSDLEMEMPNLGFGKRTGGMTQRVKAPGRWSQTSEAMATNIGEEADDDADDEEGACDVCRSADAKPSDPIVYCDGCDIPVHAECYGNPLSHKIPEGDWFCAQCQSKRPDSRSCSLCPRSGGVMKMTIDGSWAHLSCAVFVPEVFFRNADDMEGIDTSHVPSKRYLAKCAVCEAHGGACVDCTEIGCKSRFHVSCALKKDLAMEFRNGRSGAIVISFCPEHTAAWDEQQERKGRSKYKIVSREPQKPKVFQRSKSR